MHHFLKFIVLCIVGVSVPAIAQSKDVKMGYTMPAGLFFHYSEIRGYGFKFRSFNYDRIGVRTCDARRWGNVIEMEHLISSYPNLAPPTLTPHENACDFDILGVKLAPGWVFNGFRDIDVSECGGPSQPSQQHVEITRGSRVPNETIHYVRLVTPAPNGNCIVRIGTVAFGGPLNADPKAAFD